MWWTLTLRHPSARRLSEAIDAQVDAGTMAHLAKCVRCRRLVARLAEVRGLVAAESVPEPSPLFWERFSWRLSDAISREPEPAIPARVRWFNWSPLVPVSALLTVAAVAVGVTLWRQAPAPVVAPPSDAVAAVAPASAAVASGEAASQEDGSWGVLIGLADDVDLDEAAAAGFGPTPGAAEWVADSLSSEERDELVRLIRTEIGAES